MIAELLYLAAALAGTSVPAADIVSAAMDVRDIALDEAPLPLAAEEYAARTATARLLLVFAWRESAWRADALGDNGAASGVMQLHAHAHVGHSSAEVRADRRLGLRLGLRWMRAMTKVCGSVRRGLHAYAGGTCDGTPRARRLVADRCALAGLGGC